MQRCPKCGYREGLDWPWILSYIAFAFLDIVFTSSRVHMPRTYWMLGTAACALFLTAMAWREFRNRRTRREYEKLHPPITERLKDHLKTSPSQ
jgi:hypothetical protein